MARGSAVGWGCLVVLLAMASCGGGDSGSPFQALPDISYVDIPVVKDLPEVDTGDREPAPEGVVQTGNRYEIVLLHDLTEAIPVSVGDTFSIHAEVLDLNQDAIPAIGVPVQFAITVQTDLTDTPSTDGDAQLDVAPDGAIYTSESGIATSVFNGGLVGDRKYVVTVSMGDGDSDGVADAKPMTMELLVTSAPCGCINAALVYNGGLQGLHNFKLSVLPSDYTCDKLYPEKPLPTPLQQLTLTDLASTKSFDCLPADNYYSLFVTAEGPTINGLKTCIAASGCNDSVYLQPNKCIDKNIELFVVTMNPTGMYDSVDHFDFTNLIKDCANGVTDPLECVQSSGNVGQSICCVLYQLITFFNTPGTTIMNLIMDVIKQVGGIWGTLADTVIGLFKDAVANVITDYLTGSKAPAWLHDFFQVGQDMLGIITNLELHSDLMLSKLNNNFTVQGKQYWTGLTLYWKIGCNPSDPNYATCGAITFDLDQLKNTQFPMDLVTGTFTASIADFNKFIENLHAIKLDYGKLVLFVLDELIIKNITGGKANTLVGAAKLWLDCAGIAQGILGQIASWFGGSLQDVTNFCNGMIDLLLQPLEMFIGALSLDTNLSLEGNAVLIDQDCDLKVDRITKGIYAGQMQGNGQSQGTFTGTFEATKKP